MHTLFLANVFFVCLFLVTNLGTAVFLCLDPFLKMVVLHNTMIALWCELLECCFQRGYLLLQSPFIFLALERTVLFSLLSTFVLMLLLIYKKRSGISHAGFASLLGDPALVLQSFMSYCSVLASKWNMQIKCVKRYTFLRQGQHGKLKQGQYRS